MALFIASLFNYFINPTPLNYQSASPTEIESLYLLRAFQIPVTHGMLMIMCFISSSDRIKWEEVK